MSQSSRPETGALPRNTSGPVRLPSPPSDGVLGPELATSILEGYGARLADGHFLLTSGRHSDRFYLLPKALEYPPAVRFLGACLAARARATLDLDAGALDAVVGPAMGGVLLAHEVAAALSVRSLYAEKEPDGSMRLRRGFRVRPGGSVLIVEDAITTGGSVAKTMSAVRDQEGVPIAVLAVVHRSRTDPGLGVPLLSLLHDPVPDWAPESCPLCEAGRPLTRPKH